MPYQRCGVMILTTLAAVLIVTTRATAQKASGASQARVIILAEEALRMPAGSAVLDVLKTRLPLQVLRGSFLTSDGRTTICVAARRGMPTMDASRGELPSCQMIAVFVDGVRINNAGDFLMAALVDHYESIQLFSAVEATARYGLSTEAAEALDLWTKGRGPHARKR